jgi:acyl-CoA reductase-like NAD-dependent aldehyde dehydrogenase
MTVKEGTVLVGGEWVEAGKGAYDVINPATEQLVGHAPECSRQDAEAAAAAVSAAFGAWS